MKNLKLLALSGSLRKASYNTAAINALQLLASCNIEVVVGSINNLPLFNPDRESEDIAAVTELINAVKQADGLIIASPEYAHGISGPMKNALDWLVGGVEFPYKPIMLINTSPRASHAQLALIEVLNTMSGNIIDEACVSIPLLSSELNSEGIIKNQSMVDQLTAGLNVFVAAIKNN